MREQGVKSAIVVTTWWHTARALRCFRHYAPEMEFMAAPAWHGDEPGPSIDQAPVILIEYLKTVVYYVHMPG